MRVSATRDARGQTPAAAARKGKASLQIYPVTDTEGFAWWASGGAGFVQLPSRSGAYSSSTAHGVEPLH